VVPDTTGAVFGGRIVIAGHGAGCVSCLDVLDTRELARERMTDQQRQLNDVIYGLERDALGGSGPSVITVNSVVASLAATEVMCLLTGRGPPHLQLTYRGDLGTVGRAEGNRSRDLSLLLALACGEPGPPPHDRLTVISWV